MITRALQTAIVLLVLYLVSLFLIPFAHVVWVVILLLALAYLVFGERLP